MPLYSQDSRECARGLVKFGVEAVKLRVGKDQRELLIHRKLLCDDSPFFAAALKPEWPEGKKETIALPEDVSKVVDLYANWLYTHKIFSEPSSMTNGHIAAEQNLLIDAYIFGEKIQSDKFKNALISPLIEASGAVGEFMDRLPEYCSHKVYNGTPVRSPLRELLVDIWVTCGLKHMINGDEHPEFQIDLIHALMDLMDSVPTYERHTLRSPEHYECGALSVERDTTRKATRKRRRH